MPVCFIIDDESYAIEVLSDYVLQTPGLELAGTAQDPVEGLQNILKIKPDIVFLDVDMPKLSGLDLIELLDEHFSVVLTTAHPSYAVEAFNLNAVDFLLKPVSYKRFLQCIDKLSGKASKIQQPDPKAKDFTFLQSGLKSKLLKVRFNDIQYIESFNNYLVIHISTETLTVYLSLKDLMLQLPPGRFFRLHKSYIVNYEYINAVDGSRVYLSSGKELPIGPQYREELLKQIGGDTIKKNK